MIAHSLSTVLFHCLRFQLGKYICMKSFMAVETSYHIQITYLEEVTIPYAELGNPNNAQTVIYTL